jgi:hypothetical protein
MPRLVDCILPLVVDSTFTNDLIQHGEYKVVSQALHFYQIFSVLVLDSQPFVEQV